MLRLGAAPVDARVRVGRLVRDEQLEGCPEDRVAVAFGRRQLLEALAELVVEQLVHRREDLGPRAVVERQRQHVWRRLAPVAEHRHVGVPEAVDRLELVADEEQLLRGAGAEQIDQSCLQLVRVLELVDHDRAESQLLELPDRLIRFDQLHRAKLQVFEVERRLAVLCFRVGLREAGEELLQELPVARCELLEGDRVDVLARIAERRRARAADGRRRQLDQALREARRLEEIEGVGCGVLLRLVAFSSCRSASISARSSAIASSRLSRTAGTSVSSRPAERRVS